MLPMILPDNVGGSGRRLPTSQRRPTNLMPARKRPDWSRPLPRPLVVPGVMRLKTLADVRKLIGRMPMDFRTKETWQRIAALVDDAARGDADPTDVAVALQLVLMLEKVEFRRK